MKQRNYRRIGAYSLMILSAFSMMIQYGLQGVLASGHPTADLHIWFWRADWILWGLRALIEAVVILYLFETSAEQARDRRLLYTFEVALIALITLTIAPAIRAQGLGQTMPESVSPNVFTLWCVGLAAYTPLMMGGLATALRVQPGTVETVTQSEHTALKAQLAKAQVGKDELDRLREANTEHERRLARLRSDEATKTAGGFARVWDEEVWRNGSTPKTRVVEQVLAVSRQTVSKAMGPRKVKE